MLPSNLQIPTPPLFSFDSEEHSKALEIFDNMKKECTILVPSKQKEVKDNNRLKSTIFQLKSEIFKQNNKTNTTKEYLKRTLKDTGTLMKKKHRVAKRIIQDY